MRPLLSLAVDAILLFVFSDEIFFISNRAARGLLKGTSAAGVFSKQLQCDFNQASKCREVLAGLIHLNSEEAFNFETFNIQDLTNTSDNEILGDGDLNYHDENSPTSIRGGVASAPTDILKDVTVNLKIEKSPLLIAYDLVYEQSVVGGLSEEVYDYTWTAASRSVFEESDFEPERCADHRHLRDIINTFGDDLQGSNSMIKGGRVCGCLETGWGSGKYTSVKRSTLNCNAWPAVFRPSTTVWASRHCTRIQSPSYAVYSLRNFRWDFEIRIELEWVAKPNVSGTSGGGGQLLRGNNIDESDGPIKSTPNLTLPTLKREYFLNWANPEAYDEEFDFHFKIVFSVPQAGALPPDLSSRYYLLIPNSDKNNLVTSSIPTTVIDRSVYDNVTPAHLKEALLRIPDDGVKLDQLKTESLLVPQQMVDLSGKGCDKIGVSLFTWADENGVQDSRSSVLSSTPTISEWVGNDGFCQNAAGSCLRNQPNDLLRDDRQRLADGKKPNYILDSQQLPGWSTSTPLILDKTSVKFLSVAPAVSVAESSGSLDFSEDNVGTSLRPTTVAWPTSVIHNTALEIMLNSTEIAWMSGSAVGVIEDIVTQVIDPTSQINILGIVRNKDSYPSRFSLVSSPCILQTPLVNMDNTENSNNTRLEYSTRLESSQWEINAAPVSRTLSADRAEAFVLTIERTAGLSQASYVCTVQLWNAKGETIDERTVNLNFVKKPLGLSTLKKPENSEVNVTRFIVDTEPQTSAAAAASLRGIAAQTDNELNGRNHTRVSLVKWTDTPQCSCNLLNVWCVVGNLVECTKRIRQTVTVVGSSILLLLLGLMCGPSLIKAFFILWHQANKFFCRRIRDISSEVQRNRNNFHSNNRNKQSGYNIAAVSEDINKDYQGKSLGSFSTHPHTPVSPEHMSRSAIRNLRHDFSYDRMDQAAMAAMMRSALLNTKGRKIAQDYRKNDERGNNKRLMDTPSRPSSGANAVREVHKSCSRGCSRACSRHPQHRNTIHGINEDMEDDSVEPQSEDYVDRDPSSSPDSPPGTTIMIAKRARQHSKPLYRAIPAYDDTNSNKDSGQPMHRLSSNEYWGDTEQSASSKYRRKSQHKTSTCGASSLSSTSSAESALRNLHQAKWESRHNNNNGIRSLEWKSNMVRAASSKEHRRQAIVIPEARQAFSRHGGRVLHHDTRSGKVVVISSQLRSNALNIVRENVPPTESSNTQPSGGQYVRRHNTSRL